jgi:signal transduction histidine kinase
MASGYHTALRTASRVTTLQMLAMASRKKAQLAFASALILLLICGVAATFTIVRLIESTRWVAHTYDVEVELGDIESAVSLAARTRTTYLNSGDPSYLSQYESAKTDTHQKLAYLRRLTADNPTQLHFCEQLDDLILRRMELLDASVEMRKSGPLDESTQLRLSKENIAVAADFMDVMEKMMRQERTLLTQRREVSGSLFTTTLVILLTAFALAVLLFWIHFRMLSRELEQRERMEESARRLSGRILQLQDEERRKFSRELHDSLGQLLAMAKMHLSELLEKNPHDKLLAEIDTLLDQSISETRTISHLLHPPLLDEIGLASAVRWYVEGFAKRSGIPVAVDIPENLDRLPRAIELTLFRVLQESLTNIHRHSKSARAEVALQRLGDAAVLHIRDYGKGMSRETLQNFLMTGTRVGVGLAGMRERVREQSGNFNVRSDEHGTEVTVTVPLATEIDGKPLAAAATAD